MKKIKKGYRNPSFTIAPHCIIKPRGCYCLWDDGLKKCLVESKK
jgi:hypothetical protein